MLAKSTTISFMAWTVHNGHVEMYKKLLSDFMKTHPGIKVKNMCMTWPGDLGYLEKLLTMTAGNSAPDVVAIPFLTMPRLAEAGVVTQLDSYMKKDKSVSPEHWVQAGLSSSSWKGRLWGLPYNGSDYWITYNKRLFAQMGLTDPESMYERNEWTWESMMAQAQKLSKFDGDKVVRIGVITMNDIFYLSSWLQGMGTSVLDADGLKCILDKKPATDALKMIYEFLHVKRSMAFAWMPPYAIDLQQGAKGEKWAIAAWFNTVASTVRAQNVDWPINQVPFPVGPISKMNNIAVFHSLSVMKQSAHKDAAWELTKFMTGKGAATAYAKENMKTTRRDSIAAYKETTLKMGLTGNRFLEDALERLNPPSRCVPFNTVAQRLNDELGKAWLKKSEITQAINAAVKVANAELARAAKGK